MISLVAGTPQTVSISPRELSGMATPGAQINNVTWSTTGQAILSLAPNPNGSVSITGTGAGTVLLTGTALVTDSNGTTNLFTYTDGVVVTVPSGLTTGIMFTVS